MECILQCTNFPVTTRDLTRAFGWTTQEAFLQQDVQVCSLTLLILLVLVSSSLISFYFICLFYVRFDFYLLNLAPFLVYTLLFFIYFRK